MEGKPLKRVRSEDDESNNNVTQTKVWVNEKINDSCDPEKMKAVHGKYAKFPHKKQTHRHIHERT